MAPARIRWVLAIDGGGIRGLLPASLLSALEQREGRRCCELFDLIAGTSTGGIIACGLTAGYHAAVMRDLYVNEGGRIFSRSWARRLASPLMAKYSAEALEESLSRRLGTISLASLRGCELLVPTYVIQLPAPADLDNDGVEEEASSYFFKSWKARESRAHDFWLADVARATAAAPTYFPPAEIENTKGEAFVCIDGGIFANNPALCAYAAARQLWPRDEIRLLSLGTGTRVKAIHERSWGQLPWLSDIFSAFMDGAADTVSYICDEVLEDRFIRCEMAIPPYASTAMDNASPENIGSLCAFARRYTAQFLPRIPSF